MVNADDDEGVMSSWMRDVGYRIVIARPDHYVYGTTSSADEALVLLKSLREATGSTRSLTSRPGEHRWLSASHRPHAVLPDRPCHGQSLIRPASPYPCRSLPHAHIQSEEPL